jgi:hypothetical protein
MMYARMNEGLHDTNIGKQRYIGLYDLRTNLILYGGE